MRNGNLVIYNGNVFSLWIYGPVSRSTPWNGKIWGTDDPLHYWYGRNKNRMDLLDFSAAQITGYLIYILSSIMDHNDHSASNLLLFCQKAALRETGSTSVNTIIANVI